MGQLDHAGGRDDLVAGGVARLCGEQRQRRAEPLPAGVQQVAGGLGDERRLTADLPLETLLHEGELSAQAFLELVVEHWQRER